MSFLIQSRRSTPFKQRSVPLEMNHQVSFLLKATRWDFPFDRTVLVFQSYIDQGFEISMFRLVLTSGYCRIILLLFRNFLRSLKDFLQDGSQPLLPRFLSLISLLPMLYLVEEDGWNILFKLYILCVHVLYNFLHMRLFMHIILSDKASIWKQWEFPSWKVLNTILVGIL